MYGYGYINLRNTVLSDKTDTICNDLGYDRDSLFYSYTLSHLAINAVSPWWCKQFETEQEYIFKEYIFKDNGMSSITEIIVRLHNDTMPGFK